MLALSPKRQVFVREYLIDLNGKQAAIRAGYSVKTAEVQASTLLSIPKVASAVKSMMEIREKKLEIDAEWVLSNLVEVSNRCMQKVPVMAFVPGEGMTQAQDEEGRAVWQFDSKGANQALSLIGKHLGMFSENVNLNVKHSYEQLKDDDLRAAISLELEAIGVKKVPYLKVING
jgi:phage terminase small subunit